MEISQIRKLDRSYRAIYFHCHICHLLSYLGKITPGEHLQTRIEKHRHCHAIHGDGDVNVVDQQVGWGTGPNLKGYPLKNYTLIKLESF